MRIKYVIIILVVTLFTTANLSGSSYSSYLPGGKNYLEPNNFSLNQNTLSTIDSIRVKRNTTYMLSFSGEGLLEYPELNISTNNNNVYSGMAIDNDNCSVGMNYTECTFTTDSDDDYISIAITADGMQQYHDNYLMEYFQLEEGNIRTEYEEYISPFIDASSPEFNGAGAYVTSYNSTETITDIIRNHILVIDDIDGDITDDVVIVSDDYTPNKNLIGEYIVELKAADGAGNTAYFTLTVIVKDEISPIINGAAIISVSFDTTLSAQDIINENFTASDGHDGPLVISIQDDQYTASKDTVGDYTVVLYAEDSSGNSVQKTVTIQVEDNIAPVLTTNLNINVYHSDPKILTEILDSLVIADDYDDAIDLDVTVVSEDYTVSNGVPGTYSVVIEIEDSSNNTQQYELIISIIDDIFPAISGPSTYVFSYTNVKSLQEIIMEQVVSDNYSSLVIEDLVITNDTFSGRDLRVGTFYITVEVEDSSGNKVQRQIQVDVIDDQAPIIYVDNIIVTLSENVTFTPQDALNLLVKNRELPDEEYEVSIINDEYTGNEDVPGQYNYSLRFDDKEGNSYKKDFIIEVPHEKSLLEDDVLIRNVAIYTISFAIILFAILKRKK